MDDISWSIYAVMDAAVSRGDGSGERWRLENLQFLKVGQKPFQIFSNFPQNTALTLTSKDEREEWQPLSSTTPFEWRWRRSGMHNELCGITRRSGMHNEPCRTVMEMLHDRGYIVPDSDLTRSLTEFRTVFGQNPDLERLRICLSLRSNPKNKIMVIFCGTDEIRKPTVCGIYANLLNKESGGTSWKTRSSLSCWKLMHLHATMDWRRGWVVKITYCGGVVGAFKTYRCIV
ncbi:hypothetical protein M0R45_031075 [Rubus argutus]|uniref:RNA polymerase Rpb5 N-terminal domain-containing protein n=1 Tax=Rubus argutus TaxID=59490 RepID=A0AAW1WG57_RUBAR